MCSGSRRTRAKASLLSTDVSLSQRAERNVKLVDETRRLILHPNVAVDHRDMSQGAWGEEIAPSIEIARSMIGGLAEQFSVPQKCISIDIGMSNFGDGTKH